MKKSINCIIFHIYRIIGKFYRLIRNVQSKVAVCLPTVIISTVIIICTELLCKFNPFVYVYLSVTFNG